MKGLHQENVKNIGFGIKYLSRKGSPLISYKNCYIFFPQMSELLSFLISINPNHKTKAVYERYWMFYTG